MSIRNPDHGRTAQLDAAVDQTYRPIVGRLAGLPGDVLERLSHSPCSSILLELLTVEQELGDLRSALVESIKKI